ncbi:MAG: hypothetical protein LIO65_03275 [Odoribacter sp.]|nr:hypothetical protein [Odoribacter sp.]
METNRPKNKILNRELSWLDFNGRVLQEAQDKTVPLLQRLNFLGIFSNNQDEFIKVRVANLIRISQLKGNNNIFITGGYTAKNLLDEVNKRIDQYQKVYNNTYEDVLANMEKHGIYVVNETQITDNQKKFCRDYFSNEISQWLVPLMLRKTKSMPF